jgi:hypothetical protein
MMTLIEEMKLFLQQMCGAIGMSGTAMNVVPVVVLGVALNIAALSLVENARTAGQPTCKRATLQNAAKTELKVMRTVFVSTMKTRNKSQRSLCVARGWVTGIQRVITNAASGAMEFRPVPASGECARPSIAFQSTKCRHRVTKRTA